MKNMDEHRAKANDFYQHGLYFYQSGSHIHAIDELSKAINELEANHDDSQPEYNYLDCRTLANYYYYLGLAYSKVDPDVVANYKNACKHYQGAIIILSLIDPLAAEDGLSLAKYYIGSAASNCNTGDFVTAIEDYINALSFLQKYCPKEFYHLQDEIISGFNDVTLSANKIQKLDDTIQRLAISFFKSSGDLYVELMDLTKALCQYEQALIILAKFEITKLTAEDYLNQARIQEKIGQVYKKQSNYSESLRFFMAAFASLSAASCKNETDASIQTAIADIQMSIYSTQENMLRELITRMDSLQSDMVDLRTQIQKLKGENPTLPPNSDLKAASSVAPSLTLFPSGENNLAKTPLDTLTKTLKRILS